MPKKVHRSAQTPTRSDKADQIDRFIDAARKVGADEDLDAFRKRLRKLVEAPPNDMLRKKMKPKKPAK